MAGDSYSGPGAGLLSTGRGPRRRAPAGVRRTSPRWRHDRDLSHPYGHLSLTTRAAGLPPETGDRAGSWGCELLIGCRAIEPSSIASGKSHFVRHRQVKNQRLAAAGYVWIFGALPSRQVKAEYDRRRDLGDRHTAAMRNVFDRFLGCLHHCLQTEQGFDPGKAFPAASTAPVTLAA